MHALSALMASQRLSNLSVGPQDRVHRSQAEVVADNHGTRQTSMRFVPFHLHLWLSCYQPGGGRCW
jgi:hypothetical protein